MNAEDEIDEVFWGSFPLLDVPRPLIILESLVHIGPSGFGRDGQAKSAWLSGAIDVEIDLPDGVLNFLAPNQVSYDGPRIVVTAIERTERTFWTDRGPRDLPAYRVTATGLVEPCVVLDPTVQRWWPKIGEQHLAEQRGGHAVIDEDDRTIHFPAVGGKLTQFHRATFDEHPTYVVGRAITTRRAVPPGTAIRAIGVRKHVTGRLEDPLGERVLLNVQGVPLSVLPS